MTYTSYFYMVRFFKPSQIPLSTAIYDPKWFHANRGQDFKFLDKNGVLNGCRAEQLKPGNSCHGLCHGRPCDSNPSECGFLREYRRQLFSLDRDKCLSQFNELGAYLKSKLGFSGEPDIILLVHEAPNNSCSERGVLQEFFNCREWTINKG